jgi:hypothetical protein
VRWEGDRYHRLLQGRPCVLRQAQDEVLSFWHLADAILDFPSPELAEGLSLSKDARS